MYIEVHLFMKHISNKSITPSTHCYFFPILICFFHVDTHKVSTSTGSFSLFHYTSHDMNRFIPHVHRAQPLNGFENGPNLNENRIEYVLLTT